MVNALPNAEPVLSKIWIYPIKSLDGVSVESSTLTSGGALTLDREFALVDQSDRFINAKRTAQIHLVRSQFDIPKRLVTLSSPEHAPETFSLESDRPKIEAWLTQFFGFDVKLIQNQDSGFPDDLEASGPTIISEATLAEAASWFDGITVDNMRSRLRTNLELTGVPAFWEDVLFSSPIKETGFYLGDIAFQGTNPCQRCIVPTRDPLTGEVWKKFQKQVGEQRKASLPAWADVTPFNHYYRLAVNTKIASTEIAKTVQVGMQITI